MVSKTKSVTPPLRWQGGKRRIAAAIVAAMAPHTCYVETCCGGAAVFWAKPRSLSTSEILNDADGELINFYQVLHRRGRRLATEVTAMPYSRLLLADTLASRPRGAFARARRFWYLNRVAFGARRVKPSFGVQRSRRVSVLPPIIRRSLDVIMSRLEGVVFEAIDVARLLDLYDRPTTLFYLDPPFHDTSQHYACCFSEADHARLAAALTPLRGTWLLSYNDCPAIRRLYRDFTLRRLAVQYTAGCNSSTGGRRAAGEVLISNRPLPRRLATPEGRYDV